MRWRWVGVLVVAIAIVAYVWPRDAPPPAVAVQPTKPADISGAKRDRQVPAMIAGTVRDEANLPLAGARVCIADDSSERHCTQSGRDGAFELAGAPPDDIVLDTQLAKFRAKATYVPLLAPGETRTVDIVLAGDALEVVGVVEDILGGPIDHAVVTVETARVHTDAQGRFVLWIAPAEGQRRFIRAHAAGYGPAGKWIRPAGANVITLSPEATIAGKVVDAATGAPVANARVTGGGSETTSGPDGTFALAGLPTGTVSLEAITPTRFGKLPRAVPLGLGERVEDVVVQVYPAFTVVATLTVDGDRQMCNPTPRLSDGSVELAKPWRDETGRYHFDGVPPGIYVPGLGCGLAVAPVVVADANVEVAWRVGTGGIVKGKAVLVPGGDHLVDITLARVGSRATPFVRAVIDGRFEMRGIPAGTYTLGVTANGQPSGSPATIEVRDGETVEHDLALDVSAHGRITGTVSDRGKRAYANVRFQGNRAGIAYQVDTRDGTFAIDLPADDYQVHAVGARAWGTSDGIARVHAGKTVTRAIVLDIPLRGAFAEDGPDEPPADRDHAFTGRVVDARGPVGDALVTAIDTGMRTADERILRATTLADGTFTFTAQAEVIAVDVYRVGGGSAKASLHTGRQTTITLASPATLTGTVTRPDGARASRFEVQLDSGEMHVFQHTGGAFAIPDPGAYPVVLTAVVNGLAGPPLTVTAASAKTGIALQLPPAVTVTGQIVDAESRRGIANVRIVGRGGSEGWARWVVTDNQTDEDGRFTMRDLPPGPMRLELSPIADGWSAQTVTISVPEANGHVGELGLARARRR